MIAAIRRRWEAFTGSGDYSITVPPMDGPLQPNNALELAPRIVGIESPDNLVVHGGRLMFSSGRRLMALDEAAGTAVEIGSYHSPIVSLAANASVLALALDDGTILIDAGAGGARRLKLPERAGRPCPTAILLDVEGNLTVANGSATDGVADWKRDLMRRGSTGSIWRLATNGDVKALATDLAFPYGLARLGDGALAFCESWRHRIVRLGTDNARKVLLDELPCYPARLVPGRDGWWLAAFAPRTQMVEFMLRENRARHEMIATIHPDYWMAPRFASGRSFREPLQGGGIKQLGILKPWAPSQSYGLVARLDDGMQPSASFHSRADGTIHGVTSCVEFGGRLYASSRGADAIVAIDLATAEPR